jgi:hypothetical protein
MVLVDPQYRRQGIAAKLMSVALGYLKDKVDTIKLDATALGKPVYEKFGFEVESTVERWTGTGGSEARDTKTLTFEERDALLELDRLAFNADRSKLIERLIEKSPVSPVLLRAADDALNGYALARRGTRADYVGPVVSRNPQQAETLLDQVLSQLNGRPVYIDFNTECGIGTSILSERGFTKERDLIRMRARGPALKTSPFVVAIAGPEVG